MTTTPHGRLDLLSALGRGVLLVFLLQAGCFFLGIRLNTTASLPIGLYIETSDPSANLVQFCPAGEAAKTALGRGYRRAGVCPDGGEPLLKPVVAKAGDLVTVSQSGIAINSQLLPNSQTKAKDSTGRDLKPWPCGEYRVSKGTAWVVSTYSARSFDSRYFGPIVLGSIRAYLRPFLTK